MTFLAPVFLVALLALPVLVLLGLLHRRPRRVVVASTEIWAEVAKRLQTTTDAARPRPRLDARTALALLTALLATLGAGGLAFNGSRVQPREVRVLIDRSLLAGAMTIDEGGDAPDAATTALAAGLAWVRDLAAAMSADDTLRVQFSPPDDAATFSGAPAAVAAQLQASVAASDGATLVNDALALAPPPASPHARLFILTPRADAALPRSDTITVVRVPTRPVLRFEQATASAHDLLVTLANPDGATRPDATCELRVTVCDAQGQPVSADATTVHRLPVPAAGARTTHVVTFPPDAAALMVEVPGALPSRRAMVRRVFRVWLQPAIEGTDDAGGEVASLGRLLTALCPSIELVTAAPVDALVLVATRAEGTVAAWPGERVAPDTPVLALGPVPQGAWPLAWTDAPATTAGDARVVRAPLHPLLFGVPVADLPLDGEWWPVTLTDGARGNVVVDGGDDDQSMPMVLTVEAGRARGVMLPGLAPATRWTGRGAGVPAAVLLANALAWLLGDESVRGDATDPRALWRAGAAHGDRDLPPWAMRRHAAALRAWSDDGTGTGWLDLAVRAGESVATVPLNPPVGALPSAVAADATERPTAAAAAASLPATRVDTPSNVTTLMLLLAAVSLVLFARVALR
ncbi:MAG: BatA domain-containing protein [Planctomycetota bacterium]